MNSIDDNMKFNYKRPWDDSHIYHTDYGRDIPYKMSYLGLNNRIMICLHGFGGDKSSSVIDALEKEILLPCEVVAFDWPAHGESTAPDSDLTVENCLRDLDSMICMLRKEYPDKQLTCFATSFGAYIATLYRNDHPGVFERLILRSPALRMDKVFRGLITDEEFDALQNGRSITMGFERKIQIGRSFYDSLLANPAINLPVPDSITVMIMQGDQDDVVDPQDTIDYAESNHIRLKLFSGTDHRYKKNGDLERIIKETKDFLSTEYSRSDYGGIFRVSNDPDVEIWRENPGKWERLEHSGAIYLDISGAGGSWDKYNDISPQRAWQMIKERGGSIDEFIK